MGRNLPFQVFGRCTFRCRGRILPIVLLGMMMPVGQIFNMFLEFFFVHGKNTLPRAGFDAAVL
jgi:hypothetical protein